MITQIFISRRHSIQIAYGLFVTCQPRDMKYGITTKCIDMHREHLNASLICFGPLLRGCSINFAFPVALGSRIVRRKPMSFAFAMHLFSFTDRWFSHGVAVGISDLNCLIISHFELEVIGAHGRKLVASESWV
ncbi:hypothetical protein NPIL_354991 [Nephila pilipes]|uniref:Uncharacterized protein n=1 Tax=Nephila pilipes TaxID=299642 RepID=A0A8X6PK81_NEPPI|nr:hypothetical protein NPIL_354991 [Nephila pilipes]